MEAENLYLEQIGDKVIGIPSKSVKRRRQRYGGVFLTGLALSVLSAGVSLWSFAQGASMVADATSGLSATAPNGR